jgi:hypothetical protein
MGTLQRCRHYRAAALLARCRGVLGCCPTERQGAGAGARVLESSGARGRTVFCLDAGLDLSPCFSPLVTCHQTTVDIRLFRLRGEGNSPSPGLVKTN